MEIEFHTDVQTVFAHYLSVIDGTYDGVNASWLDGMAGSWNRAYDGHDFYFVSAETMRSYITGGYVVPGIEAPKGKRTVARRKLIWAEEGELDVPSALAGDDFPFRAFGKRDRLPGLRIDIEVGFQHVASAETLADYARWISRLIYGLENRGYKMDVNVVSRANVGDVYIKCQTAGKRTDFKAWSAMLSPGGHRHLIFAARGLMGDHNDRNIGGVGGSTFKGWRVACDPKARAITVGCHSHAHDFPTARMDAELAEALKQI